MENLIVTRETCNNFIFTYSDTNVDLTIEVYTISNVAKWNGNFVNLPLYDSIIIPHIILPNTTPNIVTIALPSDNIYVFKYIKRDVTSFWSLPSEQDIRLISSVIGDGGDYDIEQGTYWSSSEAHITEPTHDAWSEPTRAAWSEDIITSGQHIDRKTLTHKLIGTQNYKSTVDYSIGDLDSNNNIIYNKINNGTYFTYQVCRFLHLEESIWDNAIINFGTSDSALIDISLGINNTDLILAQSSNITNAAYRVRNATLGVAYIIEYSLYTIFCELINCRLNILKRVLGEIDNCKEQCDCIAVYDFNAFSAIYETIQFLYEDLFGILNLDVTSHLLSSEELLKLTTLDELLTQYKKYCIECETPCKNC